MASPRTGVTTNGVPELPPILTLLHEQTDHSLHQMIRGAIHSTLLESLSIQKSVPSQLPLLASFPSESKVASLMASSASSAPSSSVTPTPHVEQPCDSDVFVKRGQDGVVKSGTLRGLIRELIVDSAGGMVYRDYKATFLALYPVFTTGDEVLRLLLERFQAVSPSPITQQSTDVQFSIILVLEFWLEECNIAATNVNLLQRVREFAAFVQASSTNPVFFRRAQRLLVSIDKALSLFVSTTSSLTASTLSFPDPPPQDFLARDLAHVLTVIEGDRYQKLTEIDYVYWLEGSQESNAVSSFIVENKKLGYWAERSILTPHDRSERAENLKYFLLTIKECRLLRNFSSACALSAGIATAAITGLKLTYGDLDKRGRCLFRDAEKLISINQQFMAYRTAIREARNGCIPWLSIHLHDLKMIHRAYPALVDEDGHTKLINFERCRRIHRRIRQIRDYEPPIIEHANAHHAGLCTLVNAELNSIIINQQHCDWAQKRGEQLAAEEQRSYDMHEDSLRLAGFLSKPSSGSIPTRRPSTHHPRRTLSALMRPTPQNVTVPSSTQAPTPSDREDVHKSSRPLDVFSKQSEQCLDNRIIRDNPYPVASGGYADIYQGLLGNQKVAIKCIRYFSRNGGRLEEPTLLRRLWREYETWTRVSHPIVLKCFGFTYDFSPEHCLPSLISPWMSNGTLRSYVRDHPETDRLNILIHVANGLSYLHEKSPSIVHGDIRGDNILISDSGRPCLSDFGLSKVLDVDPTTIASEVGGSLRWMSPELFRDDHPSTKSDVWAFAMTVLEIMTGQSPYAEVKHDAIVLGYIDQGQLPRRSLDFTNPAIIPDEIWAICQKCWNFVPRQRPSMQVVFSELNSLINGGST